MHQAALLDGSALDALALQHNGLDLSRIYAAPISRLGYLAFESQGASASQRRMPAARVIEAVDVLKDAGFGLATGFPCPAPDQLGLDGLEERLDNGVDAPMFVK
jgi:hypothetical protein